MRYPTGDTIEEHYKAMCQLLSQLAANLNRTPGQATLGQVPPTLPGEESQKKERIEVNISTGKVATTNIVASYRDLLIDSRYSQKSARRYPGVLSLKPSPDAEKIKSLVEQINSLKESLRSHVTTHYATQKDRFDAIHQSCPGVMTLHLYRQIRCFDQRSIQSIRFTWQQKDTLVTPDKTVLLKRIDSEIETAQTEGSKRYHEQLRAGVVSTSAALLRERRPVREQPAANIVFPDGMKTVAASVPFIVIQDSPIEVKALPSFDANQKRKRRSDLAPKIILGNLGGSTIEALLEGGYIT